MLSNAYYAGKQVTGDNGVIVLIFCWLWEYRRGITEGLPRDYQGVTDGALSDM